MNTLLELKNIGFSYEDVPREGQMVLSDISFSVGQGEYLGLIGHTGSGKSTLLQIIIGLLKPQTGTVFFEGQDIFGKGYDLKKLRSRVGLVFQYPEHQLFEETVFKDVCYGPLNIGLTKKECELRAYEALKAVNLPDDCFYASPFELSGGQKRRVAIAGILAMKPDVLVLDEPTAGLDPVGKTELLEMTLKLKKENNISVVLVSHSMEDVAVYADRLLVLDKGRVRFLDRPERVFSQVEELESIGLSAPQVTYIMKKLKDAGMDVPADVIRLDEARDEIISAFRRRKG